MLNQAGSAFDRMIWADSKVQFCYHGYSRGGKMWPIVGTLLFISLFAVPSIVAHAGNGETDRSAWRKLLYLIYSIYLSGYALLGYYCLVKSPESFWFIFVTFCFSILILLSLLPPFQKLLSGVLTWLNALASLNFIFARNKTLTGQEKTFQDAVMAKRLFFPDSLAHVNGWILYLFALGLSMQKMKLSGFINPTLGTAPELRHVDLELAGDFLSALIVVLIGVGLFVSRKPREILFRLSLVKPGKKEFALGILLCILTFAYDYVWSLFTHAPQQAGAYAGVMRAFNEGTYLGGGDVGSALLMSIAIGMVAGIEEEITNRGALQPVLGILPAAFLHAALHTQFDAAPLFILQIFGWSALMGTVKYYTNTTTTIIAHTLFNFISCFLIGFNP